MQGYWDRPETDDSTFCTNAAGQRWLRTGDVGQIDEDGFIRSLVDRLKDMIAVGGFKVSPKHIEEVLYAPGGEEGAGRQHAPPHRGETPRAYVALAEDADPVTDDALRDWFNPRVGKHERVDAVVVRDKLPKTMIGKLSRKDLLIEIASEGCS